MPPHIEVDSHQDDGDFGLGDLLARRPPPALSTDQPSTLFLDYESVNPQFVSPTSLSTSCSLSRRQSDPDFTSLVAKENDATTKKAVKDATAPVVSVITAIIGPESAYVRSANNPTDRATSSGSGASTTTTSTTTSTSTAKSKAATAGNKQQPKNKSQQAATAATTATKNSNNKQPSSFTANTNNNTKGKEGKIENRPLLRRATRYVSKKGWKVVKSLPKRVSSSLSTAGNNVKVPGRYKNVV